MNRPPDRLSAAERAALLATGTLALAFVAGVFLVPVLEAAGHRWGETLRSFYRPLCHQFSWRSLTVDAQPLAVCARCTGLYLGGVLGIFLMSVPGVRRQGTPRPAWLGVLAVPTLVDVAAASVGWASLSDIPRMAVAFPPGVLLGWYLAAGVADLAGMARERLKPVAGRADARQRRRRHAAAGSGE